MMILISKRFDYKNCHLLYVLIVIIRVVKMKCEICQRHSLLELFSLMSTGVNKHDQRNVTRGCKDKLLDYQLSKNVFVSQF